MIFLLPRLLKKIYHQFHTIVVDFFSIFFNLVLDDILNFINKEWNKRGNSWPIWIIIIRWTIWIIIRRSWIRRIWHFIYFLFFLLLKKTYNLGILGSQNIYIYTKYYNIVVQLNLINIQLNELIERKIQSSLRLIKYYLIKQPSWTWSATEHFTYENWIHRFWIWRIFQISTCNIDINFPMYIRITSNLL